MTRPLFSPSLCGLAWGLLLVAGNAATANEPSAPGVVRISKPATVVRAQSDAIQQTSACKECEMNGLGHSSVDGYPGEYGYGNGGRWGGGGVGRWRGSSTAWGDDGYCDSCYGGGKGGAMLEYFRCKFGYFIPTGCGGAGCPPLGKYARVYPQDPGYFDQRDGQAWGAAGYGVPIAVPLAPVVGHQYNYSWGIPSSRLTPVSRIAPY